MTTNSEQSPPKSRRWLLPALVISAAVNLLVVGVIAGAFLSPDGPRRGDGDDQRAMRGVLGEPFFRALPPEQRRGLARDVIGNREQFRESREALRTRVEGFLNTLRAENFDRSEVERQLGEQRQTALQRQELGEKLLLDRLEAMTQAERAAYADALADLLKGIKRR